MTIRLLKNIVMALAIIIGFANQSCEKVITQEIEIDQSSTASFKATNVSAHGDIPLTASSYRYITIDKNETVSYKVTLTADGVAKVFTGKCKYNELPVLVGNEVELMADFDEYPLYSYLCFSLPDGTRQIVSKTVPSCKWIVPDDFTAGWTISAQCTDESGKAVVTNTTTIKLISL